MSLHTEEDVEAARLKVIETEKNGQAWLGTACGEQINLVNPDPKSITFYDIARGLSNECRYNGQIKFGKFLSVAEHSVYVATNAYFHARRDGMNEDMCRQIACQGLVHDASEAYLKDLPTPLKHLLPEYKVIEKRIQAAIAERFDLPYPWHTIIHQIDARIVSDEKPVLLEYDTWPEYQKKFLPLAQPIACLSPSQAEAVYREAAAKYGLKDHDD